MRRVLTSQLEVSVTVFGDEASPAVMLLHGWPDGPGTWDAVVPELVAAGYRVIVPALRGFGETAFRNAELARTGEETALAVDVIELAGALGLEQAALVGHDWGGRAVFPAAILAPERFPAIVSISVPWVPQYSQRQLGFLQARAFWYQFYLSSDAGEAAYRADPLGFSRTMWDTWSPEGWYREADWTRVAAALSNPDQVDVVLQFYQSRWREERRDPAYRVQREAVARAEQISVPTLVIHGGVDTCTLPELTEGMDRHFCAGFERVLIADAGHFPQRERPDGVAAALISFLNARVN